MRQERTVQGSIFDLFAEHEIGRELEAVLRCALLKQYRQLSYEELAFHLEDSASFRALYEERQAGTLSRAAFFYLR
ncbi:IS5 family transposase [Sinorhizobium meliloti]